MNKHAEMHWNVARAAVFTLVVATVATHSADARVCELTTHNARSLEHEQLLAVCKALDCRDASGNAICPGSCFGVVPPNSIVVPESLAHRIVDNADATVTWNVTCNGPRKQLRAQPQTWHQPDLPNVPIPPGDSATMAHKAGDQPSRSSGMMRFHVVYASTGASQPPIEHAFLVGASRDMVSACKWESARTRSVFRTVRCSPSGTSLTATAIERHLYDMPNVLSVSLVGSPVTHNHWSTQAVTHGDTGAPFDMAREDRHMGGGLLDGTGQVLGSIDTGLDINSIYLRDERGIVPLVDCGVDGYPSSGQVAVPVASARKVIQYVYDHGQRGACGDSADAVGHGTHTAAAAVGNAHCDAVGDPLLCGATVRAFDGVAPGARLAIFDAGPDTDGSLIIPADIGGVVDWARLAGARVHSNSWGITGGNRYTSLDAIVDEYALEYPEMLLVVSAGNGGCSDARGTVNSPGLSKNALTIGSSVSAQGAFEIAFCGADSFSPSSSACASSAASDRTQNTASYSSCGAHFNGRRAKPDLIAPGFYTWSASNGQPLDPVLSGAQASDPWKAGLLRGMAGTSMSTPVVAGAALVVRQYFQEGWWPCGFRGSGLAWTEVPATLVKAILIASARPLAGIAEMNVTGGTQARLPEMGWPGPQQGYGMPSLHRTLRAQGGSRHDFRRVPPLSLPSISLSALPDGVAAERTFTASGQAWSVVVCPWEVPGGGTWEADTGDVLRATLVWADRASMPGVGYVSDLVNDLDLLIFDDMTSALLARGNDHVDRMRVGLESRMNPLLQPDTTSNVEVAQVERPANASRAYRIQVSASRILIGPQKFSIVLSGGWGTCNASDPVRCATNQTNSATQPETQPVADANSPLLTVDDVAAQDYLLLYTGTVRMSVHTVQQTCAPGANASFCPPPDSIGAMEFAFIQDAPTSAATDTIVRVRTPLPVDAIALCGSPPLTYPPGAHTMSSWLRITLTGHSVPAVSIPVYFSNTAIMTGTRAMPLQDLVYCVPGTGTWVSMHTQELRRDDRIGLATAAVRLSGTASLPRDVILAIRTGFALVNVILDYCRPGLEGCDCQFTTTLTVNTHDVSLLVLIVASALLGSIGVGLVLFAREPLLANDRDRRLGRGAHAGRSAWTSQPLRESYTKTHSRRLDEVQDAVPTGSVATLGGALSLTLATELNLWYAFSDPATVALAWATVTTHAAALLCLLALGRTALHGTVMGLCAVLLLAIQGAILLGRTSDVSADTLSVESAYPRAETGAADAQWLASACMLCGGTAVAVYTILLLALRIIRERSIIERVPSLAVARLATSTAHCALVGCLVVHALLRQPGLTHAFVLPCALALPIILPFAYPRNSGATVTALFCTWPIVLFFVSQARVQCAAQ